MGVQLLMMVALYGTLAPARVLTLGQALETAQQHQPQLWQARASAEAASARADELRAPILPQVTLTAGYQRTTANFVARPGAVPSSFNTTQSTSLDSFNFWSGGLTLNQYIWDFGVTTDRWRSSRAAAESLHQSSRAVEQQIIAGVRTAYFNARAQLALIQVARENLTNLELHLKQIEGFAAAGTRNDLWEEEPGRANLVGVISGSGSGRSLIFNGHIDTVPPGVDRRHAQQLLRAAVDLVTQRPATLDLKIAAAALEEMGEAFEMFSHSRGVPKVTIFGSARRGSALVSISMGTWAASAWAWASIAAGSSLAGQGWSWGVAARASGGVGSSSCLWSRASKSTGSAGGAFRSRSAADGQSGWKGGASKGSTAGGASLAITSSKSSRSSVVSAV